MINPLGNVCLQHLDSEHRLSNQGITTLCCGSQSQWGDMEKQNKTKHSCNEQKHVLKQHFY